MSTRTYPLYRLGNPQLRVFLPNFWMKLIKPEHENHPKNKVQFIVSNQMTRLDVKNYLEKIYNVPVMNVRTLNHMGKTYYHPNQFMFKDDDYKIAWVTLPKDYNFEFPDLFKDAEDFKKETKSREDVKKTKEAFKKATKAEKNAKLGRQGIPSFFGL